MSETKPNAELQAMIAAAAAMLGRRGGLKKSSNKTAAARANAKRPRPNRRKGAVS